MVPPQDDDPAPLTGEALARQMAQAAVEAPDDTSDLDEGFLDFADHYREQFKATAPSGFGKSPLIEPELPPRFEDVSLCVDCRYCHVVTIPVNVRVPMGNTGQRAALGKIRRCLLGLKLSSDEGLEAIASMRKNAQIAPLAVECSHFSPWTDSELSEQQERRAQHIERMKLRREAEALRDADEQAPKETP